MTEFILTADSEAGESRSHGYPVLEAGNVSFPSGCYVVGVEARKGRSSCRITHDVKHAELIGRLLREGAAKYCCAVSSPVSSYRRVHFSEDASHDVEWEPGDMGEPPLFTPMVVATESHTLRLSSERDGVHRMWDDKRVDIKKGCRLVIGSVIRFKRSLTQLMRFVRDDDMAAGSFRVDAESQPFGFVVKLAADLHKYLQHPPDDVIRSHIMIHIVTACLALLQRDFSSENGIDDERDRNLEDLADFLDFKELPHWTEGDDFHPELVATRLYPHPLDDGGGRD